MFEFKVDLTPEEYLQFNLYHAKYSKAGRPVYNLMKFLFPLVLIVALAIFSVSDFNLISAIIEIVLGAIICTAWFLLYDKFITFNVKNSVKAMQKTGKLPYSESSMLTFDQTSITDVSKDTSMKVAYSAIEQVCADEAAYYFYMNSVQAFILPFRVFENLEQKLEFENFIKEKLPAYSTANK